jgi:hypothetical protein
VPPYPLPEQHFYGECEEVESGEFESPFPNDETVPEQVLPPPRTSRKSPPSSHTISDQLIITEVK